jgi:hypothetical protein
VVGCELWGGNDAAAKKTKISENVSTCDENVAPVDDAPATKTL